MAAVMLLHGSIVFSFNAEVDDLYVDTNFIKLVSDHVDSDNSGVFSLPTVSVMNKFGSKMILADFCIYDHVFEEHPGSSGMNILVIKFRHVTDCPGSDFPAILERKALSELRFYQGLGYDTASEIKVKDILANRLTFMERSNGEYIVYDLMKGITAKPVFSKNVDDVFLVPLPRILPILTNPALYCEILWKKSASEDSLFNSTLHFSNCLVSLKSNIQVKITLISEKKCHLAVVVMQNSKETTSS